MYIAGIINSNDVAPMVIFIALMLPFIIAMLLKHQQKMTIIMRENQGHGDDLTARVKALESEVYILKQTVHETAIALDKPPSTEALSQRLNS